MDACKATGTSSRSLASIRVRAFRIRTSSSNSSRGLTEEPRPPPSTFRRGQRDRIAGNFPAKVHRVSSLFLLSGAPPSLFTLTPGACSAG
jgi:hypothetical protein